MKFVLIVYIFTIIKICYAGSLRVDAKEKFIEHTSVGYNRTTESNYIKVLETLERVFSKKN